MKLIVIGGVGIENKELNVLKKNIKTEVIGGSAWFTAIVGKALSLDVKILSRIGDDKYGIKIKDAFKKKGISFCGTIEGKTQIFASTVNNGEPCNYDAEHDNLSLSQFFSYFDTSSEYDIIIATYNEPDIFPWVPEKTRINKSGNKRLVIANPSGSIITMGTKVINMLRGYDIVTMNRSEAESIAALFHISIVDLLIKLNECNDYVFITDKDAVDYIDLSGQVTRYNFAPITNIVDATGAGDSFTVSLAYCFMLGIDVKQSVSNAVSIAKTMCMIRNKSEIKEGGWLSRIVCLD
jgi:sugar/nucleoside kinase (ribokinase family)